VITDKIRTAASGSALVKASPATVTLVVRFGFFAHAIVNNSAVQTLASSANFVRVFIDFPPQI
jgi:hypothetical protein